MAESKKLEAIRIDVPEYLCRMSRVGALIEVDVIRRIAYRGRMLADTSRFDAATFNLLTTGSVEGRAR